MKKCFACVALLAMLLSLGTAFAAADDLPDVFWTSGHYAGASPEAFSTLGDIELTWDPDLADKLDLTDGDLSDWYNESIPGTVITPDNMISWVGGQSGVYDPGMPVNWKMTSFYAADADFLYVAFDVVDANFVYATDPSSYNGDAIQLCVDFGGKLGELIAEDPSDLSNNHSIFYSFACVKDGAPIEIRLQESDQDGMLSEANGDPVKGSAKKTDEGWSVELALGWDMLGDHYMWKAWEDYCKIYVGTDERLTFKTGLSVMYLNRTESAGEITWAAGAVHGWTDENGTPLISWTPYDNSATLILPCDNRIRLNADWFVHLTSEPPYEPPVETESWIEETALTEPPYEPPVETEPWINGPFDNYVDTMPSIDVDTAPPVETAPIYDDEPLRDAAEDRAPEDELNAILEKYGCTAVLGTGTLTALLTLAAAAYAIRKRK